MRNIYVEKLSSMAIAAQKSEFVERKGIGHPDSVADGLAECVSRALCKRYLEKYGRILHHNTDECQIVGGQSAPKFGGGVVLAPAYILLVGRAIDTVNSERFPVRSIAIKAAHEYLEQNFAHLDVDTDVMLDCKIGRGSVDLTGLYDSRKMLANDTSFGIGYAPLSETELLTLRTADLINYELKRKMAALGEDIKVMANRIGDKMTLTIAVAIVDSEISSPRAYIELKAKLKEKVFANAKNHTARELDVHVNTGDNVEDNIFYLTVTGLSMENGDDGSVGRGNRINGLITPNRPMSMEASAGKNPVTHVGKLYNIMAFKIANDVVKVSDIIEEVHVRILSQIGKPIDAPYAASIQLITDGELTGGVKKDIERVADEHLAKIASITDDIVAGKVSVF